MSTTLPPTPALAEALSHDDAAPRLEAANSSASPGWNAWLREPLVHFVLIGAALFATDHLINGRADDGRSIVVGRGVDAQARAVFQSARGRAPNAEELTALRRNWLDNEILYREGLALQLDRGDDTIRERVIFKALTAIDAGLKLPPRDEKVLRDWFEKNRAKYDEPARFDFDEAVLTGDNAEGAVRAFVERLNKGGGGEVDAGLRVFKGRPNASIVDSYGSEFAQALESAPPGEWRAIATRSGWRAMRLNTVAAGKAASFDALRGVVMHDWVDATMAEQRTAAVRALEKKYQVRYEGDGK